MDNLPVLGSHSEMKKVVSSKAWYSVEYGIQTWLFTEMDHVKQLEGAQFGEDSISTQLVCEFF